MGALGCGEVVSLSASARACTEAFPPSLRPGRCESLPSQPLLPPRMAKPNASHRTAYADGWAQCNGPGTGRWALPFWHWALF